MKMETPKMDVVRFEEADVLAASGPDTRFYSYMNNWGGTSKDASLRIEQSGNTIANYDWQAIESGAASHLLNDGLTFNGTTLHDLIEDEQKDTPTYSGYNGEWVSTNGINYTRQ